MGNCIGAKVQSVNTPGNSGATGSTASASSAKPGGGVARKSDDAVAIERGGGRSQEMTWTVGEAGQVGGPHYLHAFSYADLRSATRNFKPDSLLGEGGFGSVFKGHIDERTFQPARPNQGLVIAVKKLNPDGLQGHNEWLAELKFLGTLHHPNLVKLIGYCYEEEHRLLVYEFLSRGSLENHLFGRSHHTISWAIRLKIAIDAARGLAFLHDAQKPVIYRDFKTSNILLDSEFNAKLSDFGLAKDGPTGDKTHVTTRVMGTYGYAAPEYVATGRLTAKSDVYGFGVVLLEILTGRRAVDKSKAPSEQNLVEWAMPYLADKRKWSRVLDQRLDGQYSLKGAKNAASLALECLSQDPKFRPTMKHVLDSLQALLGPKDISKLPSTTSSTTKQTPKSPLHPTVSQGRKSPKSPLHPTLSQDHKPLPFLKNDQKHVHTPKQDQKLVHPPKPSDAYKLPSPKQKQHNNSAFPSPSPTRGSPHVQGK
eukprot:c21090_g1_i1 orf=268-1710(+)